MKHILLLFVFNLLIVGCNTKKSKETTGTTSKKSEPIEQKEGSLMSGDYSSLYTDYHCNISISEVAKVLEVAESDLSFSDYPREGKCDFDLEGFGKDTLGGGSGISWGVYPSSKAQNKKEIASYLKNKKDGLKIMGMDIQLAETKDCYIAYQPGHGRIIIYNEHYDYVFLMNYGIRSANTNRTKEQHEELRLKMTDLANYLLKKHRK